MTIATLTKNEKVYRNLREADADDLETAAALIDLGIDNIAKHGWKQGTYGNACDGFCALGSMRTWSLPDFNLYDYERAATVLNVISGGDMVNFNDAQGRRKREVISKMRRAARRARALARAKRLGKI